ncbi:DUF2442 domain-containing protein [Methylogaea oryzae]|uniref:DUF2442 domain-containing protein n=1 Tax=Methylogaea oryzae TaxID=1295382 RepID=A0A8D5AK89_9GAMM|nr:DUF2442 domain-containing protein [Methylogaea oryzae]BBL70861.1 hypothetical protein MoryE10_14670 [Methylogaea oryzae]
MLLDVIHVEACNDFSLRLQFENGEWRRFDMTPWLSLKPWSRIQSLGEFRRARVDYGTVVWPGEIDIAPETLYDQSEPLIELSQSDGSARTYHNTGTHKVKNP